MKTKEIVTIGILAALYLVLSRMLSFNAWNTRIGFSFVPLVLAGVLLGPVKAGVTGGIADVLAALLMPTGPYFPGFTLTAVLTGVIYGLFLYEKQTLPRIIGAVLTSQVVCSLLLNTLWISILYKSPFPAVLATRLTQFAIMSVVQIAVMSLLLLASKRFVGQAKKIIEQN